MDALQSGRMSPRSLDSEGGGKSKGGPWCGSAADVMSAAWHHVLQTSSLGFHRERDTSPADVLRSLQYIFKHFLLLSTSATQPRVA